MKVIRKAVLTPELFSAWSAAKPINCVVIDNFADEAAMKRIAAAYPDPSHLRKSRDFIFAKNKYERAQFAALNPDMAALYEDFMSAEFKDFLTMLVGKNVFIDPAFHGGGLHMGGSESFLDMHADFNIHPREKTWLRELNILIYLNEGWRPEYGGSLKLRNTITGAAGQIEPLFNRCVIMLTKEHTLHGYDRISFPAGTYRKSIAAYAYSHIAATDHHVPRSTKWVSETSTFRRAIGPLVLRAVKIKNRIFGSRTGT